MQNNYRSKKFKAWLNTLQQESWQLELLISGFAIFGLFQVIEPLEIKLEIAQNANQVILIFVYILGLISCSILAVTLLMHIILRGLWIGALGLRYVSGDIDFKKLNYAPRFERHLRRRIGSFDKYISKLEDGCSVLFALSFLLIFYMLSAFLTFGSLAFLTYFFLQQEGEKNNVIFTIGIVLTVFILIGMLMVFVDFMTQGFLKKKKWLAFVYWPFYWVFSYATLTFLYRPLVYNFLDNRFGRIVSFALIPVYFGVSYLATYDNIRSNFLSTESNSSSIIAKVSNYDTVMEDKGKFIKRASIPSKVISTSYLPIFIVYRESIENRIFEFNPGLEPEEDLRGLSSSIKFSEEDVFNGKKDSLRMEYMRTLKDIHIIKIDTTTYSDLDFVFTQNKNNQEGFETVLPLDSIQSGKHTLKIYRKHKKEENSDGTLNSREVAIIPFWYYPS